MCRVEYDVSADTGEFNDKDADTEILEMEDEWLIIDDTRPGVKQNGALFPHRNGGDDMREIHDCSRWSFAVPGPGGERCSGDAHSALEMEDTPAPHEGARFSAYPVAPGMV